MINDHYRQAKYQALFEIGAWKAKFEQSSPYQLPNEIPLYIGLNDDGSERIRMSETVDELPSLESRSFALRQAFKHLGAMKIAKNRASSFKYGLPCYVSLGLTKSEAESLSEPWLLLRAADLPLQLFWTLFNDSQPNGENY